MVSTAKNSPNPCPHPLLNIFVFVLELLEGTPHPFFSLIFALKYQPADLCILSIFLILVSACFC